MELPKFCALAGVIAVAAASSVGCSGPDPGLVIPNPAHVGGGGPNAPPPSSPTPTPPVGMGDGGSDAGRGGGGVDSGGGGSRDSGPGPQDSGGPIDTGVDATALGVFANAPPYAPNPPATTAAQNHALHGVSVTPNDGVNCLTCHNGATATQFLFAGSIYTDINATTGAADVEVRVVDANGTGLSAYSDTDGNFWIPNNTALATPGQAGARDGNGNLALMPASVQTGGCNSCHNGTVQPPLHLP